MNRIWLFVKISEMKLDNYYNLEYSDFRCYISNSGVHTNTRTEPFYLNHSEVDRSHSVNRHWLQVVICLNF